MRRTGSGGGRERNAFVYWLGGESEGVERGTKSRGVRRTVRGESGGRMALESRRRRASSEKSRAAGLRCLLCPRRRSHLKPPPRPNLLPRPARYRLLACTPTPSQTDAYPAAAPAPPAERVRETTGRARTRILITARVSSRRGPSSWPAWRSWRGRSP
eukprot:5173740-Pleurochrysis_carterae.AAC.2